MRHTPNRTEPTHPGTARSSDCTLILTEGDSAKTLAISGLSVVGRDYYGVFPLKVGRHAPCCSFRSILFHACMHHAWVGGWRSRSCRGGAQVLSLTGT